MSRTFFLYFHQLVDQPFDLLLEAEALLLHRAGEGWAGAGNLQGLRVLV